MCLGGPRRLHRLAESLDDGGIGHAAAFTHRLQAVPSAALFERVDECCHDAGTTSAEWVTNGDGTAVHVRPLKDARLLPIYVVCPRQHNRREHLDRVLDGYLVAVGPRRRAAPAYLLTHIRRSLGRPRLRQIDCQI